MFVGAGATLMIVFFAVITGQPDVTVLHEGNWCAGGLPWGAAVAALGTMVLYLCSVAALARALPSVRADA